MLNHREGFYQVFLLYPLQCTVTKLETVRGCVSLKKYKSQGKAVAVTVSSKEEKTLQTFVWISSKNSASVLVGGRKWCKKCCGLPLLASYISASIRKKNTQFHCWTIGCRTDMKFLTYQTSKILWQRLLHVFCNYLCILKDSLPLFLKWIFRL